MLFLRFSSPGTKSSVTRTIPRTQQNDPHTPRLLLQDNEDCRRIVGSGSTEAHHGVAIGQVCPLGFCFALHPHTFSSTLLT